ncbi:MAG TPA: hypothetical protein PKC91_03750 [Ignavibacteria bacterium]|nr:hypothetical protein [Ignavibacteria bacterium]
MKNLKLLPLLALIAVFAFVSLIVKNASGDPVNERSEILRTGTSNDIRTYSDNKYTSDNLKRSSVFKQITAELEFILSDPKVLIKLSGYNVYPDTK